MPPFSHSTLSTDSCTGVNSNLKVENAEVRISDESTPDKIKFLAGVLEIRNGYFLVKPEPSWAINSSDPIEVPMENMDPSLEPQVGNIIEITYDDKILETYPARLSKVNSFKVVKEAEKYTLIPMVMVNGKLSLDTGYASSMFERTDHFDGEITSEVDGSKHPTENNQSKFSLGYGYQYGSQEGTIEIYMNEKWRIFATEEVRQQIQFPNAKETEAPAE